MSRNKVIVVCAENRHAPHLLLSAIGEVLDVHLLTARTACKFREPIPQSCNQLRRLSTRCRVGRAVSSHSQRRQGDPTTLSFPDAFACPVHLVHPPQTPLCERDVTPQLQQFKPRRRVWMGVSRPLPHAHRPRALCTRPSPPLPATHSLHFVAESHLSGWLESAQLL